MVLFPFALVIPSIHYNIDWQTYQMKKRARLWICEPCAQARYKDTIFILWNTVISSIYSSDQRNRFSTRDFIWSLNTNMCSVRISYILLDKYSEIKYVRLIRWWLLCYLLQITVKWYNFYFFLWLHSNSNLLHSTFTKLILFVSVWNLQTFLYRSKNKTAFLIFLKSKEYYKKCYQSWHFE